MKPATFTDALTILLKIAAIFDASGQYEEADEVSDIMHAAVRQAALDLGPGMPDIPGMEMFDNAQNMAAWDGMTKKMPYQGQHISAPTGPIKLNGLYWQPGDTLQSYQARLNQFANDPMYQKFTQGLNQDMAQDFQLQSEKSTYTPDQYGNQNDPNNLAGFNQTANPSTMFDPYGINNIGGQLTLPPNYAAPPPQYGTGYDPSAYTTYNGWNQPVWNTQQQSGQTWRSDNTQ